MTSKFVQKPTVLDAKQPKQLFDVKEELKDYEEEEDKDLEEEDEEEEEDEDGIKRPHGPGQTRKRGR